MQHETLSHSPVPRPIAIEVDGEPVGVVVPSGDRYRFLAVRLSAFDLDGETFESVDAARLALGQAVRPPE